MKKFTLILIGSFAFSFAFAKVALGVWPASTTLEPPQKAPADQGQVSQGMSPVVERLQRDEKELAAVVELLKQHEKQIQELIEIRGKNLSSSAKTEDQDGHSLH